jgi:hypothetical protein
VLGSDVQNSILPEIDITSWLTDRPAKLNSVRLNPFSKIFLAPLRGAGKGGIRRKEEKVAKQQSSERIT